MTAPTAFMAETHERFLKAVVKQLPIDRIMELHLFPSIKQGGVESGVAVVAVAEEGGRGEDGGANGQGESARALEAPGAGGPPQQQHDAESEAEPHQSDATGAESAQAASVHANDAADSEQEAHSRAPSHAPREASGAERPSPQFLEIGDADTPVVIDAEEAERLDDAVHAIVEEVADPVAQTMAVASLELADLPLADAPLRYTIYSARYRLVLKGPDRGKWAVDLVALADAPLVTVETVVRGVQRRAGEVDEVGRWTGEELRVALRLPAEAPPAA